MKKGFSIVLLFLIMILTIYTINHMNIQIQKICDELMYTEVISINGSSYNKEMKLDDIKKLNLWNITQIEDNLYLFTMEDEEIEVQVEKEKIVSIVFNPAKVKEYSILQEKNLHNKTQIATVFQNACTSTKEKLLSYDKKLNCYYIETDEAKITFFLNRIQQVDKIILNWK